MKIIEQSHEILSCTGIDMLETAGRTCYQSTPKGEPKKFVKMLKDRGHHAMIEFGDITVQFITNRGVTHELVRHRMCSFAQESTRYVRYDGNMEFIKPIWWEEKNEMVPHTGEWVFSGNCEGAELTYKKLMHAGWSAQQAREVLPNSLKTEIVVKANFREWRHIFSLRCAKAAHPQMRALMLPLLAELQEKVPVIFDDI